MGTREHEKASPELVELYKALTRAIYAMADQTFANSQHIVALAENLGSQTEWLKSHTASVTKCDLRRTEENIMEAIQQFAQQVRAHHAKLAEGLSGVKQDVLHLKMLIEKLQTSAGTISPEDQATLDELQSAAATLAGEVQVLDEQTPPPPPPA